MLRLLRRLCLGLSLGFLPDLVAATPAAPLGEQALEAFDSGDLARATASYEQLVKAGTVNGSLFYNLGILYYRTGRLGDSVAAFLAARRYLPRDPDNEANLRFVLGKIHDKLEPSLAPQQRSWYSGALSSLTGLELAWTTAALFALWGGAIATVSFRRRWNHLELPLGLSVALPLLLLACTFAKQAQPEAWAAVGAKEAKVYSGPGSQNTQLFALQEGAPLLVIDRAAGGYYRVALSDGKQGWIADNEVKLFGPIKG